MKFVPTLHKLSNGVTIILDSMDLETTSVKVSFFTGSRDEKINEKGLTHFCEHMLCKGTTRFPTKKIIDDYFEYHSGSTNASTGNSGLSFYGRILAENVNILVDFLGDQIQNSLFLQEKIEIERGVISDELRRSLDNEGRQLSNFMSETLFNGALGSSLGGTLGNFENIESFTRDQMLEFLSLRLSAKNCIIGISGKIHDETELLKCLEKTFGWLPSIEVSENSDINYIPAIAHNSKPDKNNIKLRILFPEIWDQKFENRYKRMSVSKFERFMGKKMYEVLRHENGLVYGFGLTDVGNEKFCLNGFATETSVKNIEKAVSLIAKNAFKIYNENEITDEDLDRFFRKNRLGNADWLESATSRCDRLTGFHRNYGLLYDFYNVVEMSKSIRRDEVIENSRGYFDGDISIITQGADFEVDLKSVWQENFK